MWLEVLMLLGGWGSWCSEESLGDFLGMNGGFRKDRLGSIGDKGIILLNFNKDMNRYYLILFLYLSFLW